MTSPQLPGEGGGAGSDTPGPPCGASGPGCVLDGVRHEAQRSPTLKDRCTRTELDPVTQPGRPRLYCNYSPDCSVGDAQMLFVLHAQVFEKGE